MGTISIQLHEALDGTPFATKREADIHNSQLHELAFRDMSAFIHEVVMNNAPDQPPDTDDLANSITAELAYHHVKVREWIKYLRD